MLNLQETWLEYPDNSSNAVIWYMNGCCHNCPRCSNPELQCFIEYDEDWLEQLTNFMKRCRTNKLVLCGGDPLFIKNQPYTAKVLQLDGIDVCIYTGYTLSYIPEEILRMNWKYLKCGTFDAKKYRPSKKTDTELILASPNQVMYKRIDDNEMLTISSGGIVKLQ